MGWSWHYLPRFYCALDPAFDRIIDRNECFSGSFTVRNTAIELRRVGDETATKFDSKWFYINPILCCVTHQSCLNGLPSRDRQYTANARMHYLVMRATRWSAARNSIVMTYPHNIAHRPIARICPHRRDKFITRAQTSPACSSALSTCARAASLHFTSGRRRSSVIQSSLRAIAYLTGAGEASQNIA